MTGGGTIVSTSAEGVALYIRKYFANTASRLIVNAGVTVQAIYPLGLYASPVEGVNDVSTVDIYGTLQCTNGEKGFGITTNGGLTSTTDYPVINIHEGARVLNDENGSAIYAAGYAEWNIQGEVTGGTGIYAKSGIFNISPPAVISGTGAAAAVDPSGDGAGPTGSAIVLETNAGYVQDMQLNITGDTTDPTKPLIRSPQNYAIEEYTPKDETSASTLSMSGGVLDAVVPFAATETFIANNGDSITGGTIYITNSENVVSQLLSDHLEVDLATGEVLPQKYTVSFEPNGGTPDPEDQVVEYNKVATKPADPAKEGYSFVGWFTDAELTKAYDFATPVTADLTLYAKWALQVYTVTFESNEGSAVAAATVEHGQPVAKPADPTKEGYSFAGWYTDAGLTTVYDFATPVTTDITLYAKWNQKTYNVTFNSNLGSDVIGQLVFHGDTVIMPEDPTRAGYTFEKWYSDEALTTAYDFTAPVTADMTLYAGWNEEKVILNDNATGITVSGTRQVLPEGVTLVVEPQTKQYAGYVSQSYDIYLMKDGKTFALAAPVTVVIPYKAPLQQNGMLVFHDDGTQLVEIKDAVVAADHVTFTAEHFSVYVLANKKPTSFPETGESALPQVIGLALLSIAFVTLAGVAVMRKRRVNGR